ncbi:aldolase/citrate lyase family protein [Thalassobaculum sp.]|uniref:HpcH/HpaI aldolase family protein n=1 Tax=Thalassobaculum sp. TaxID=2022740 RepID=UPI0032EE35BB
MFRKNHLKAIIAADEPAHGVWLQLGEPSIAEIASLCGYDFLILDNEHGPAALETTVHSMRAAQAGRATVLVRVPGQDPDYLKRVLDAGAEAVMIPMVETAEQARAVVAACKYPPTGRRGYSAPTVRASGYGADPEYAAKANDELFICVQIESDKAVEQAGAIAAVEGVDMVFIGVADLSGSIGLLGQPGRPEVDAQIRKAEAAVKAAGKPLGTIPRPGHSMVDLAAEGYRLLAGIADSGALRAAFLADVAAFAPAKKK